MVSMLKISWTTLYTCLKTHCSPTGISRNRTSYPPSHSSISCPRSELAGCQSDGNRTWPGKYILQNRIRLHSPNSSTCYIMTISLKIRNSTCLLPNSTHRLNPTSPWNLRLHSTDGKTITCLLMTNLIKKMRPQMMLMPVQLLK
jgi:hypothetical protein